MKGQSEKGKRPEMTGTVDFEFRIVTHAARRDRSSTSVTQSPSTFLPLSLHSPTARSATRE